MILRRRIGSVAYPIIQVLVIAAICGSFTIAAAQDDVSREAFKGAALLRKQEERAARDIDKYVTHLDKSARAMTRLGRADRNDLRKRYESFSDELKNLEAAQLRAVSSLDKMKATGVEYFSSWEKANASISDPELRDDAARRRSMVMMRHIDLAQAIGDIGLQLQPFMSRLQDLRAFLGADLSPGTVRLAGERIRTCQAEAEALKSNISGVQATFRRFLSEMPK